MLHKRAVFSKVRLGVKKLIQSEHIKCINLFVYVVCSLGVTVVQQVMSIKPAGLTSLP